MMCELTGCGNEGSSSLKVTPKERRLFLKGAVSLPLAYVLSDPRLANAQAKAGETISFELDGFEAAKAFYAEAENPKAPTVILIHEWWGLNDQIKAVAIELTAQGYNALAVDLFKGSIATQSAEAIKQIQAMNQSEARATMAAAVDWARTRGNGRVGTIGWCFGGGWSLQTALLSDPEASVVYYGNVDVPESSLVALKTPILGHFGTQDRSINPEMVGTFQKRLRAMKRDHLFEARWYTANHGFANPTSSRYDDENTALAWARTLAFLSSHL